MLRGVLSGARRAAAGGERRMTQSEKYALALRVDEIERLMLRVGELSAEVSAASYTGLALARAFGGCTALAEMVLDEVASIRSLLDVRTAKETPL
jgi:hypothetical protein